MNFKIFLVLLLSSISTSSFAQYCRLDSTFATNGTAYGDSGQSYPVKIQPDGKILIGGTVHSVTRYLASGNRDSTFGLNGSSNSFMLTVFDIALQPDGKIVIAGTYNGSNFAVCRLLPTGQVDNGFGLAGIKVVDTSIVTGNSESIAIQPDGKILVSGTGAKHVNLQGFCLMRFDTNGVIDSSFANNGIYLYGINRNVTSGLADTLASNTIVGLQSSGKIILSGTWQYHYSVSSNVTIDQTHGLQRLLSNGTLDPSFAMNNHLIPNFDYTQAQSMIITSDDKILLGGAQDYHRPSNYYVLIDKLFLIKYDSSGNPDNTFGTAGVADQPVFTGDNDTRLITGIALDTANRIVASCFTYDTAIASQSISFGLTRYNTNGSVDYNFGRGGTDFSVKNNFTRKGNAKGLAIQTDNKIIVTGFTSSNPSSPQILTARYNYNGVPPDSIITNPITGPICGHHRFVVPFTTSVTFNRGNIFTAQLSDSNGSFNTPVSIGSLTDTLSGSINAILPTTSFGHGFRIRVVASNPHTTGTNNGSDILIYKYIAPTITKHGTDTLFTGTFLNYQWLLNGSAIPNAISQKYVAATSGSYKVAVTNINGCLDTSAAFSLIIGGIENENEMNEISVYPNPCAGRLNMIINPSVKQINLFDLLGHEIYTLNTNMEDSVQIDIQNSGIYILQIKTTGGFITKKVIVNK